MQGTLTAATTRVGMQLVSADPFWVLVREGIFQQAVQTQVDLVPMEIDLWPLSGEKQLEVIEEILAAEVHALIAQGMGTSLALLVAEAGVPTVILTETDVQHPLICSPRGLYEVARIAAGFLAGQIERRGRVLVIGGHAEGYDKGQSRLDGFCDVMADFPEIMVDHLPTPWTYEAALEQAIEVLSRDPRRFHAIFGLSDSTALAGLHATRSLGLLDSPAVVVGVNGDPLALAAILEGSMAATVETPAMALGRKAVELAVRVAHGEPLPQNYGYLPRLITVENVAPISAEKLVAMASLPGRLVGIHRHQEQERLIQLETSLEISRRVGRILDRQQLYREIVDLIRINYGYDEAQIFMWSMNDREFVLDKLGTEPSEQVRIALDQSGLLGYTFLRNQPTFIPEMRYSHRFPPDPYWPATRSRVILPIHQGTAIIGLLDLHSRRPFQHTSSALIGLQTLADQLGTALRNAELYGEALAARAEAERANQLKDRLLANVSHELRTPLNVIQGYSQAALGSPGPYGFELPPALRNDLRHIYASSQHLGYLINDLLDLSKAEIGELEILTEPLDPRSIVEEVFQSLQGSMARRDQVEWRKQVPETLPTISADPVRLRQILLNLLSNAAKFTEKGRITLGVQAQAGSLHVWVEDTGRGILLELQERIFETFSTAWQPSGPGQGIGLGLRVTHELVKLHNGSLALESTPGVGTTFHVYLPLLAPGEPESQAGDGVSGRAEHLSSDEAPLPPHISILTRLAVQYIWKNYGHAFTREDMASALGVTAGYLTHVFRQELGMAPWEYLTDVRIARAKDLLTTTSLSMTDVAGLVGYNDAAYFTRVFSKETGRSPRSYRKLAADR